MQEISRFFQRVRAVGDDDGLHIGLRQKMRHTLRQLDPDIEAHVLAIELRDLLGDEPAVPKTVQRQGRQQVIHPDLPGGVAGMVQRAGRLAGNGSASPQDHNFLPHRLQTFKNWIKIQLLVIRTVSPAQPAVLPKHHR